MQLRNKTDKNLKIVTYKHAIEMTASLKNFMLLFIVISEISLIFLITEGLQTVTATMTKVFW